jgi:hypothetical protein
MNTSTHIDIPGWQSVQPGFKKFILSQVEHSQQVYNFIVFDKFQQACPDVVNLIESYFDVKINRVIVFKMTEDGVKQKLGNKLIHTDSGHSTVRLNWPVLNPDSVVTKHFRITDSSAVPKRYYQESNFKNYIDIYDPAVCEEISSICVNQPTIFTVNQIPHGMFAAGDKWPRIMCSFNFVDDSNLIKYLQKPPENP